ncbi:MAG: DUF4326 domain-containing protein [Meiothermus sp.]|nr:DUF4326 domain-containing protein [Meiothermus sp.]
MEILIRRHNRQKGGNRAAYADLERAGAMFVYCGRPGPLGNPFRVGRNYSKQRAVDDYRLLLGEDYAKHFPADKVEYVRTRALERIQQIAKKVRRNPTAHRIVLLCPCYVEGEPCHAEVIREKLLEVLEVAK